MLLGAVRSKTQSVYVYRARLTKVKDGDTIECDIDLGFKMRWVTACRFVNIDAHEASEKYGVRAKNYTEGMFSLYGPDFFLHTDRDEVAIYNRVAGRPYLETPTGFVDVIASLRAAGYVKGTTPLASPPPLVEYKTKDILEAVNMGMRKP